MGADFIALTWAPCGGVDNKVPQLHATKSAPLDYLSAINYTTTNPNPQNIKEECSGQFRNNINFKQLFNCLFDLL